ncbi:MAG: hypothetical protein ACRC9V_05670, partial [Aeromonas sp.]
MREHIDRVMPLVRDHLIESQRAQQRLYDRPTQSRELQPGDRVLILTPSPTSNFLVSWKGPCTIVKKVGAVNYCVHQPRRRKEEQLYHINLLEKWVGTFAASEPPVIHMGEQL